MKRKTIGLLGISALLLLAGAFLGKIAPTAPAYLQSYLISIAFAILVATAFLEIRGRKGIVEDERTKKIERASIATSWTLTYGAIGVLVFAYQADLVSMTAPEALSFLFFFMVAVQLFARTYFEGKGDA